jgi:hypothetical protein
VFGRANAEHYNHNQRGEQMSDIKKEVESRIGRNLFPADYESAVIDQAIGWLDDMAELDEAAMCVRWQDVPGAAHKVPVLYIYFAAIVATPSMPKLHMTELGQMRPAHSICLVSLPSCERIRDDRLQKVIREGVETFLKMHNAKKRSFEDTPDQALTLGSPIHTLLSKANRH